MDFQHLKSKLFRQIRSYTDQEYYLLTFKPELTEQQKKFMDVYEDIYLMNMTSFLCMIPAGYYMFRTYRYRPQLEGNVIGYTMQQYKKLFRRMMVFLATGTALMINSKVYEYHNELHPMMKEIGNQQKSAMRSGHLVARHQQI